MLALFTLPHVLASANLIEIFERCGLVDKLIVVGLALFSLIAWTIMFGKHRPTTGTAGILVVRCAVANYPAAPTI